MVAISISNNSQDSWHISSSSLVLGAKLESLDPENTPPCLPYFPLPRSPSPYFPTSSSTRWTTHRKWVSSWTITAISCLPRRQAFKIFPKRPRVWHGRQPTEQHLSGINYHRGSASGRGSTGGGQRHWRLNNKNDRDRNTLITRNSLRVHSFQVVDSRQNMDANQSN